MGEKAQAVGWEREGEVEMMRDDEEGCRKAEADVSTSFGNDACLSIHHFRSFDTIMFIQPSCQIMTLNFLKKSYPTIV